MSRASHPRRCALPLALLLCLPLSLVAQSASSEAEQAFRTVSARFVEDLDARAAQAGYQRLVAEYPTFAPPYYNLARLAESSGEWDVAIRWYRAYLEREATGTWSELAAARLPELERLAAAGPAALRERDYRAALGRARSAVEDASWGEALAELDLAREIDPKAWEAPALAGWIALRQADFAAAEEPLQQALELAPADQRHGLEQALAVSREQQRAAALEAEAQAALAADDLPLAASRFEQAAELQGARPDLILRAAEAWALHGDHAAAARHFRAVQASEQPALRTRAADGLARLQPYLATTEPERQTTFGDLRGGERYLVGSRALRMGEYAVAERELDAAIAAIRHRPQHARYFLDRARLCHVRGDDTGARQDLAEALRIDDALGPAYRLRGALLLAAGEPERARTDFELALDLSLEGEELAAAHAGHARCLMLAGDHAAAHEAWSAALEQQGRPAWLHQRALCADALERRADAVADLRSALELAPGDAELSALLDRLSSQWYVFMSPITGHNRHRHWVTEFWPDQEIAAAWDEGLTLTHISAHDGRWIVAMADGPERGRELVTGGETFPIDDIANKRGEGYVITNVAYSPTAKGWAISMNQDPRFGAQQFIREQAWPKDWIKQRWDEGLHVTAVAKSEDTWVVVMSRVEGYAWQSFTGDDEVPLAWARTHGDERRTLDILVPYADGQWCAVATQRPGAGEQVVLTGQAFPHQRVNELAAQDHIITAVGFTRFE